MNLAALLTLSFLGAALARPTLIRLPAWGSLLAAAIPALLFGCFAVMGFAEPVLQTIEWVPSLGVSLSFRLDGFSLLFALLITGIGSLVVLYAGAYFANKPREKGANFIALILLFMGAMLGTVLSDSLIGLYAFWELTSLVSFLLIGFDSHKPAARKAALQSLIVTAGGGLALFAGILLIGMELGTFSLSDMAARGDEIAASPLAHAILVLVLIGAFTKSAQVPFHFWLPNAMAAPTPASAYLHSATMVKLGVYLLARLDLPFSAMPAFGPTLVAFGAATLLVASLGALSRSGYKAVLAHSTVGSLGLLVLLIGLDGPVAAIATVSFILAHALYKATLFFCAGTAIHATGRTELREINGLGRALPATAGAAALAALAMAGLAPTFSFIAKEYVFEAQLESSFGWWVIAVAVLGNAAFVAIALIVTLRPFFLGQARVAEQHHGETPGLATGPLVLAVLGIGLGLAPGPVASFLVGPAATALAGAPVSLSPALWHGWTPMLALSAAVVALGFLIYLAWPSLLSRLSLRGHLDRALGDAGYNHLFGAVLALAERSTRILQNGDQHRYTAVVVASTIAIVSIGLAATQPSWTLDLSGGRFSLTATVVLALTVAGAVAAITTRSLIRSVVAVGVVGFGSALIFLVNGAPDLALTQFAVEVLITVILTALLLRLPAMARSTRTGTERRVGMVLAGLFAVLLFVSLATLTVDPIDLRLTEFFAAASYPEAFGRNVVNVILVDFRAIDTLGEMSVIAFAAMAVWGLLRRRTRTRGSA
ncbi:hydrogen gas-evolving membrane-bound hydrogenase subunit E [Pseudoroseomonas globiformis]|uniref:Hydrogen gas-evolving membrane-bound hydrogenase subunit E n=1 Tax=Teichococcus globiformis TaxID=2307229 RepID=A0ABV7FUV9_9PROT